MTRYVVGSHIYFPRTTFGVSLLYAEHDRMLSTKAPPQERIHVSWLWAYVTVIQHPKVTLTPLLNVEL